MFDGRGSGHSPIDANTMQTVPRQIVGVLCHNQGDNDHVPTIHKGFDVPMLSLRESSSKTRPSAWDETCTEVERSLTVAHQI